jgi:hypothetical protein
MDNREAMQAGRQADPWHLTEQQQQRRGRALTCSAVRRMSIAMEIAAATPVGRR